MQSEPTKSKGFGDALTEKVLILAVGALFTSWGYQVTAKPSVSEERAMAIVAAHPSVVELRSELNRAKGDIKELEDAKVASDKEISGLGGRVAEISERP